MRIAHITDLHVEVPPRLGQLFNKRLIGATNLYLLGRSHHFSARAVEALVAAVLEQAPDALVCTGDLTATGTPEEFSKARERLDPLLRAFPTRMIPGNHDVYTGESVGRFAEYFGEWCGPATWQGLHLASLDVCRAHVLSSGYATDAALAALDEELGQHAGPSWILLHYPLRGRKGAPYGPWTRNVENAAAVEALIDRHPGVTAVLHGHEHHGFSTRLPSGVPIYNPGASGYNFLPDRRRTAHFNVYDVEAGRVAGISRFAFDGERFLREPGGAYATGG